MKISGFSMAKNATKLYYPVKEVIQSILPIVDEFVFALGDCDEDDRTRQEIESIGSDKIKIIDTVWDLDKYPRGMENAHQTDIAKNACSGDWLFYLQADEVVHEKYLPVIQEACEKYLEDTRIEGLLFKYLHFWGDYDHYQISHGWYPYEIRIVRNDPDIHSWESAQSFRRIPNFDGINYRQQEGTYKLNVALIDAYIYHYGWVRPPELMRNKMKSLDTIHHGQSKMDDKYSGLPREFDYGPLDRMGKFKGTHPAVMHDFIQKFNWGHKLQHSGKPDPTRGKHKHEKFKYRLITFIEQKLLFGTKIGYFRNYKRVE
jgi:hypothetical protein